MPENNLQPESNVSTISIEAIAAKAAGKDFSTSEHVYDPQKRTPIKAPVAEICPTCGQIKPRHTKAVLTHMNDYINESGARVAISSAEEKIDIKGTIFYRAEVKQDENKKPVLDPETQQPVFVSKFMPTVKPMIVQPVKK